MILLDCIYAKLAILEVRGYDLFTYNMSFDSKLYADVLSVHIIIDRFRPWI